MNKIRMAAWLAVFAAVLAFACGPKPKETADPAADTAATSASTTAPAEPVKTDTTPACAPVYVKHPAKVTITAGQTAELSVDVSGDGPFTYQWYEADPAGSKLLPDSTSKIKVSPKRTTGYFVWTYNACGGRISDLATVRVE